MKNNERKNFSEPSDKGGRIDLGKFSENPKKVKKTNVFKLLFKKNKAFDLSSDSDEKPTVDAEAKKISERFNVAYNVLWIVLIAFVVLFFVFFGDGITTGSMQYMFRNMFGHGDALGSVSEYYFSVNDNAVIGDFSGVPVLAGSDRVVIFAPDGSHQFSDESSYSLPVVKTSDKYILIYDQGGSEFAIYDAFGTRYSQDAPGRIYCGALADNGNSIIARRGSEYNSEIAIYSPNFEMINLIKKNNRVASLDIKDDGSEIALLSYSVGASGNVESELMLLETSSDTPKKLTLFNEGMPLECKYLEDGGVALLFDDALCILDSEGNRTASCTVDIKESCDYFLANDGSLIYYMKGYGDASSFVATFVRLSESSMKKAEYTDTGKVVTLNIHGDYAYIITEYSVIRLGAPDLQNKDIYIADRIIHSFAIISDDTYVCFADSIVKISFEGSKE